MPSAVLVSAHTLEGFTACEARVLETGTQLAVLCRPPLRLRSRGESTPLLYGTPALPSPWRHVLATTLASACCRQRPRKLLRGRAALTFVPARLLKVLQQQCQPQLPVASWGCLHLCRRPALTSLEDTVFTHRPRKAG